MFSSKNVDYDYGLHLVYDASLTITFDGRTQWRVRGSEKLKGADVFGGQYTKKTGGALLGVMCTSSMPFMEHSTSMCHVILSGDGSDAKTHVLSYLEDTSYAEDMLEMCQGDNDGMVMINIEGRPHLTRICPRQVNDSAHVYPPPRHRPARLPREPRIATPQHVCTSHSPHSTA